MERKFVSVSYFCYMEEEVQRTVDALKKGKVILYPTDTVWGLGCDCSNEEAVREIQRIKGSSNHKALIILVSASEDLYRYVQAIPDLAWELLEYSEKPVTIVYPRARNLPEALIAEDGSVAIRVVKDAFCTKVIQKLGRAITSTSANLSGQLAPSVFSEIDNRIKQQTGYVVNHRHNENKARNVVPSTIVKVGMNGEIKFLRK